MIPVKVKESSDCLCLVPYLEKRVKNFKGGQLRFHVKQWEQLTSDPEILHIVSGDSLDFVSDPPVSHGGTLIKLTDNDKVLLALEIQSLLDRDIIVPSTHERIEYVSPIFPVYNSDNSLRLILNLKKLNLELEFLHFKMESIKTVLQNITPFCFMASLDLKSAYYSVPIAPYYQRFLKFEWEGSLYQFQCYPNGLGPCPRKFTKVTKVPLSELRKDSVVISGFIDDFHIQGDTFVECEQFLYKSIRLFDDLGFVVHPTKSNFIPSQEVVYLGFTLNSRDMTVSVTQEKKEKLLQFIHECLFAPRLTIRAVACLVGKLIACLPGSQFGALYYRNIERDKIQALRLQNGNFDKFMVISNLGRQDLRWWAKNLVSMSAPIHLPPIAMEMSCDASNTGWGAVLGVRRTGGAWNTAEHQMHINCKEMLSVLYALRSFATSISGKHVRILSDNTTAVSVINKMGTVRSPKCNFLAQEIWHFCKGINVWITCAYLPGVLNVQADYLSRKIYKQAEWMLNPPIFRAAVRRFDFTPTLDCFASRLNKQLSNYASFRPDPFASFVDCFTINWGDYNCYVFPPFSVIGRVLQKIRVDKATALCVFPLWTTQAWWPLVLKMLCQEMWILKPSKDNLVLPQHPQDIHPLHQKMKLVVCLLSGTYTTDRVWKEKL